MWTGWPALSGRHNKHTNPHTHHTGMAACVVKLANTADIAFIPTLANTSLERWRSMMSIVLSEFSGKQQKQWWVPSGQVRLLCLLACALWTAVLCNIGWPGSAVALSYILPLILVLQDFVAAPKGWQVKIALLCTGVAICGVALQPGWFNMLVAWALLLGTSLMVRADAHFDALSAVWSTVLNAIISPWRIIKSTPAATKFVVAVFGFLPRPAVSAIALPLVAGAVFVGLLAVSNPVIENALYALQAIDLMWLWNQITRVVSLWSFFIFASAAVLLWPAVKDSALMQRVNLWQDGEAPSWYLTFFKPSAVISTLILLNMLFAIQNVLDVKYVWLTGEMPAGLSQVEYVRRGAYSLIVTVLLAAVFVVFALRKNSQAANNRFVRFLVYAWIAQNMALVASSAQRTMTYINDTGWTELRISALLWMGLVSFGLAAVIWRVSKNLGTVWLVNANFAAASVLLAACSMFDLQGFVAERNVDKAIADPEFRTDFEYMRRLGPNAFPALLRFSIFLKESNVKDGFSRQSNPIAYFRLNRNILELQGPVGAHRTTRYFAQNNWRSWTWRYAGLGAAPTP